MKIRALLFSSLLLALAVPALSQTMPSSGGSGGGGLAPPLCGDSSHALGGTGSAFTCQAITGSAGGGNANFGTPTGNTANHAVTMANTTTGLQDAGFAPAVQGTTHIYSSNQAVTAAQFASFDSIINTASVNLTYVAASTLPAGGGNLIQNVSGTTTVTPNGSDQICDPTCHTGGAAQTYAAGYGLIVGTDSSTKLYIQQIPALSAGGVTQIICNAGLTGGTITSTGTCALDVAHANIWTAQQSNAVTTLSISTATFTPTGASNNYKLTLVHATCPCTLANPSATPVAGTAGVIQVIQSSTGSDTIGTWGSQYIAPGGTSAIALSAGANAQDFLSYYVIDATHILLSTAALNASH